MADLEALPETLPSEEDKLGRTSPAPHGPSGSSGKEPTKEMILRSVERQSNTKRPSRRDDPDAEDKYLSKQTHLHLNGAGLTRISNLRYVPKIEVLYLYDNRITVLENVGFLRNMRLLYLQHNNISHITGLEELKGLQKLYLDNNCIQLVSGLHANTALEELHLSNQRLPPGLGLEFTPASVAAISNSLRVLNVIGCGVTSQTLYQLFGLSRLRRLDLGNNTVDSFEAVEELLRPCPSLTSLDLRGCPVCKLPKYRETLTLMSDTLATLDDEPISMKQREFLLRFQVHKMKAQLHAEARELAAEEAAAAAARGGGGGPGAASTVHSGAGAGGSQPHPNGPQQHAAGPGMGAHMHHAGPPARLPPCPGGFNNATAQHRGNGASGPGGGMGVASGGRAPSRGNSARSGIGGTSPNTLGLELGGMSLR